MFTLVELNLILKALTTEKLAMQELLAQAAERRKDGFTGDLWEDVYLSILEETNNLFEKILRISNTPSSKK